MFNKIYLIKDLAPWMMDELLAFSYHTKFTVVLIREPKAFYQDKLLKLKKNDIQIIIKPFNYGNKIRKIFFIFRFFFRYINKFMTGYSAIIGWKSLVWFFMLDLSLFQKPLSLHSQFATQATILSLMLKNYFNDKVEYSFTFHAYDIYFNNKWFTTLVDEAQISLSISNYNIKYVKDKYKKINYSKLKLSRLGVFSPKKIALQTNNKADQIVIGFLSWFVEKKGVRYLLEAINIINIKYPNKFKFIFAGDGPLKDEIISFVKKNELVNSVSYIGQVNGELKENFFLSLNLFILPSIKLKNDMDGIPVVLMEAVSYGIPVISTNISGIPEICINNYNGFLIEQKSPNQIVEAIVKIYSENKLFVMPKNSLKIFEEYDLINNTKNKIKLINW